MPDPFSLGMLYKLDSDSVSDQAFFIDLLDEYSEDIEEDECIIESVLSLKTESTLMSMDSE